MSDSLATDRGPAAPALTAPVMPPGMPGVSSRANPAPVTSPGTFRAAWEVSDHEQRRKALRRKRIRTWTKRLLVVAVLAGVAYAAYPRVHTYLVTRSLSPELRAYVGGDGVAHHPLVGGYTVRFPKAPGVSPALVAPKSLATPIVVRRAVAIGRDYRVAVWDADLPGGALPMGTLGTLRDPRLGGRGALTGVHEVEVDGERASVGTFTTTGASQLRVAVVAHGGRLFVIRVQAASVGPVFAAAVRSFRFTP